MQGYVFVWRNCHRHRLWMECVCIFICVCSWACCLCIPTGLNISTGMTRFVLSQRRAAALLLHLLSKRSNSKDPTMHPWCCLQRAWWKRMINSTRAVRRPRTHSDTHTHTHTHRGTHTHTHTLSQTHTPQWPTAEWIPHQYESNASEKEMLCSSLLRNRHRQCSAQAPGASKTSLSRLVF